MGNLCCRKKKLFKQPGFPDLPAFKGGKGYSVMLLGLPGSGKSAFTMRFIADEYYGEYDPTFEDSYRTKIQIEKQDCPVLIVDTAGVETWADDYYSYHIRTLRAGESDAVILAFDLTSVASFEEAKKICEIIKEGYGECSDITVLCGMKQDLISNRDLMRDLLLERFDSSTLVSEIMSFIPKSGPPIQEIRNFYEKENLDYFECSSMNNVNVNETVERIIRKLDAKDQATAAATAPVPKTHSEIRVSSSDEDWKAIYSDSV